MKKAIFLACILLISVSALSGCITDKKGTLVLQITDAPSDLNITKACVNISYVEVHRSAAGNLTEAGWYRVLNESQVIDLISVKDVKEFLASQDLSIGHYTQIRLHISEANATIDGIVYDLTIPSKIIRLTSGFWILPDKTVTLTLDFDAQESIHKAGNENYIMNPTIKIIEE